MAKWQELSKAVPSDFQVVWVRINFFYGSPFRARYSASGKTFEAEVTGLLFPFWTVARWKNS